MKRKQYTPIVLIFALAIGFWLFYEPVGEYKTITGNTQGTTYQVICQDRPSRNLQPAIEQLLNRFDQSLSTYAPNSLISKINRNEGNVRLDSYLHTLLEKAQEVYMESNGAFDITIAPVANAWGFGSLPKMKVDSQAIDSLLQFVGMDKIELNGHHLVKLDSNVQLNVNAIAQGYAVDVLAKMLERKGIVNYLVEIGGELRSKGVNAEGKAWRIGIDKPEEGNMIAGQNLQAVVSLHDKALATSGNYRKFYEEDGIKYSHSLDPRTGYPVQDRILSATVLSNDCMDADAYATALMVMGFDKSISFLKKHPELDAYLIYSDEQGEFRTYLTPGMMKVVEELE